jgi:hypothetical protein
MKATSTRILAAAFAAALALAPVSSAFARGGFRGGGFRAAPALRPMGGSRSFGGSRALSPSRAPSGWGSATKPIIKPAAPSSSFASPSSTPRFGGIGGTRSNLSSQRGLFNSASRNGTLFSSKAEATQAFRSRYAKDYGSTFASEPAARPSYIPASTFVGGRSVNIMYNAGLGGYGYYHPTLGTWLLYDALADAAMSDNLMYNRGYYWGGAPVYVSHGPRFFGLAFAVLVLFLIAAIAVGVAARRARHQ